MKKRTQSHRVTSQRIQMSKQRIHGSTGTQDAEHGYRAGGDLRSTRIGNEGGIASLRDGSVEGRHGRQIIHAEDDFSGSTGAPSLQQTRPTGGPDHVNGSVSALRSDFSRGQRQILPDDEGHGRCIMHRRHALHPSPPLHLPTWSSR